jgi:hypothetical protein
LASFNTLFLLCLALNPLFTLGIRLLLYVRILPDPQGETFLAVHGLKASIAPLHIGDQFGDILLVHCSNRSPMSEIALSLPCFGGEDMAGKSVASLNLSGAGFFESLCSSSIGLDLWHIFFLLFGRIT